MNTRMMKSQQVVTPVKTGVQCFVTIAYFWIPASAGMTDDPVVFYVH
jgi:hypothetical protein